VTITNVPTKEALATIIYTFMVSGECPSVRLNIGYAIQNEKDKHYVKKIGRDLALSRVKNVEYTVNNVTISNCEDNPGYYNTKVFLKTDDGQVEYVVLKFSSKENSAVHFVDSTIDFDRVSNLHV
jgi:cadmium resistance protein CadD (predicted permease)